jgi:hypothetical protein
VHITIRRGNIGVAEPALNGAQVDALGQPEARRRVSKIVKPTTLPEGLPVRRSDECGSMQLGSAIGRKQEIVRRFAGGHVPKRREQAVGDRHSPCSA